MGYGNAAFHEIIALAGAIVGVAALAVIITNGGKTAKVITASGNAFVNSIKAATAGGN